MAGRAFLRFCDDAVLVAHNAAFDLAFLRKHRAELGAGLDAPVLDTILMSALLYGPAAGHGLEDLAARLGVTIGDGERHTAIGDALATARILERMLPMLRERGVVTLADALAAARRFRSVVSLPEPAPTR
mgnify:CR=1 FL=1